jgi:trehalose 6-phosphate phosphatase
MAESHLVDAAVVSGRALRDLVTRIPPGLAAAGNHGLEIRGPGFDFVHPEAEALRPKVHEAAARVAEVVRRWPGAWMEDKGLSATMHFRNVTRDQHGLLHAVRRELAQYGPLFALRAGHLALEIRPKVAWDKGSAVEFIRERLGGADLCLCIGDDRTDETMFRRNRGHINVRVGSGRPTVADFHVADPGEVAILLGHVLDTCELAASAGRLTAGAV